MENDYISREDIKKVKLMFYKAYRENNNEERLAALLEIGVALNQIPAADTVWSCTIKGDPRTKKNHQIIAGRGKKCPVCHKPEKYWIKQSDQHDAWAEAAAWQLRDKPREPIDFPVGCKYICYMATRRRVDGLNLYAAIDDLLVKNHILADDNSNIVVHHDGSRVYYDKENPRVEIEITKEEP